ncbi:MAG: TonB-dependent receptor [Acidobacteria bacterium]|nr:TonB-dependent receptor [Acidobacteriota bacterium]
MIYSPEQLLNFNIGYSHPKGIDLLVEYVYVGKQFADDLNTVAPSSNGQRGLIPNYGVWNATVNYRIGGTDRFAPTLFVTTKNLRDDTFIVDRRRGVMPGIPRLVQGA